MYFAFGGFSHSLTKTPRFTSLFASQFSVERAPFSKTRPPLTIVSLAEANEPLLLHLYHVLVRFPAIFPSPVLYGFVYPFQGQSDDLVDF